jgi:glyoxylase-like metal-dependent hydrolase (beta-lactamase superfamily II)
MKSLHRPDLYAWSAFDRTRNVDFSGTLLVREGGNIAFDPMPVDNHDAAHIDALGGVAWVLITNADHVRAAAEFVRRWDARVGAPAGDRDRAEFKGLPVALWLDDGDALDFGVSCLRMDGSKTAGELAFLLEPGDTVVCGDLVRGQRAGSLNLLPDPKLRDKEAALASVQRLAELPGLQAVVVGDGQSVFRGGAARLGEIA